MSAVEPNRANKIATTRSIDLRRLHGDLASVFDSEQAVDTKLLSLIELVVGLTNAAAGICFFVAADGTIAAGPRAISKQALTWSDALIAELATFAKSALKDRRVSTGALQRNADTTIITVPVFRRDRQPTVLSIVLLTSDQSIESYVAVISLCGFIVDILASERDAADIDQRWQNLREVVSSLSTTNDPSLLPELFQRQADCDYAILAIPAGRGKRSTILYPAELKDIDTRSELARAIDASFAEVQNSASNLKFGRRDDIDAQDSIILRSVGKALNAELIFVADSKVANESAQPVSLMLIWSNAEKVDTNYLSGLADVLPLLGNTLNVLIGETQSDVATSGNRLKQRATSFGIFVAIAIAMLIPLTHRISADATIEPIERKFVVAPFDGTLKEAFFKPGDIVKKGTVLASLDGKDLMLDLEGIEAELEKIHNRRRSAIATGMTSDAQLAQFEIEKLQSQRDLLESRRERIDLTSSIDGVLLAGDLNRHAGSPLRTGQSLFEIAPLDRLVARINIPDHAITYCQPGMPVSLRFDAIPDYVADGKLERILPRSQIVNNENVFIAEVAVDNHDGTLKPGMTAKAKLDGERRAIGWILFHRAWNRIRVWLW